MDKPVKLMKDSVENLCLHSGKCQLAALQFIVIVKAPNKHQNIIMLVINYS